MVMLPRLVLVLEDGTVFNRLVVAQTNQRWLVLPLGHSKLTLQVPLRHSFVAWTSLIGLITDLTHIVFVGRLLFHALVEVKQMTPLADFRDNIEH